MCVSPALRVRPLFFAALPLLALALLAGRATSAQSSAPSAPRPAVKRPIPPQPPALDQELGIGYWTTETGWTSELQLRNNAASQDVTVTPVLRLADGAETALAAVTVKPQEVKSIDLGAAISAAAAPQLVGTYGSLVLHFRSPSEGSLYAAEMIHEMGHPVAFHIDAMGPSEDIQAGSREGIWWLPNATASDYLIVTNQGKNTLPVDLSLYDASGKEHKQRVLLGRYETTRYSVRKLVQSAGLAGSFGGIKVSATTHAGSLDTLHFLFDESVGFSAILKMFDYDPRTKPQERDYAGTGAWTLRAPMLALSSPDPALAFPPGTTLRPQLFVRNITPKPLDAALRFNWRTISTTGKAPGPQLHLLPYETRLVNVSALQDGAILPKQANWASVTLTTNALPDEIMAVATSYDETLKYGAQTPFSDQLNFQWEGGMWEYDPYHNSIITAGNGGTKPTQAAFTIFYNQGTQRYDLEQTLQPDEQMWIDVGKLVREQIPDKNGKALPMDLASGSYEFRDLTDKGVGTLFEGKIIYDKTYGHVAYGCSTCCGYSSAYIRVFYDPLGVPLQGTAGQGVNAYQNCTLTWDDVSDSFWPRWASANTGIATVNHDYYATHNGVSVGSTTSSSSGYLDLGHRAPTCPQFLASVQDGVNVNPPTVTIGSFSQNPILQGSTATVTVTVNPSATISLTIGSTGTGAAAFDGQGGSTTKTISGTTTVTVYGSAASSSTGDLTLTATDNAGTLAYSNFSVTSGACTLSSESDSGSGTKNCPATVTLQCSYINSQYCPTCSYSCVIHTDGAWSPTSPCSGVGTHIGVSLAGGESTSAPGTFSASDCNWHYAYFVTTVRNAQGVPTNYVGGSIGLRCTSYPNGSPCP